MTLPFVLPPVTEGGALPHWEGNGFRIGDKFTPVLEYSINNQGWNDNLTHFHEESAGEQHFIDRASRGHAIQQLKKYLPNKNGVILEIGCSSGFMLKKMHSTFPDAFIIGSDVVQEPLKKLAAEVPTIPLLRFDITHCPLPENSIDVIVTINVLEHIENDAVALQQIYRILKPGGILIIEVPAGPDLYDAYDKFLMHYRRYRLKDLSNLLQQNGFVIKNQSHLGCFLYPGFRYVKLRNKHLLTEPAAKQGEQTEKLIKQTGHSKILHAIMQTELLLGKVISYPVGIRCLVTCMKAK